MIPMIPEPKLHIPEKFNRNSAKVSSLMPAEQSGQWLLQRMQQHLGIRDYATVSLLDFGCGVRFTQAILNLGLPIGEYVGVDCFREMIDFLAASVNDPRFTFHLLDTRHPLYNPQAATALGSDTRLPVAERHFDVVSMFSVLTHQRPEDTGHILTMLRRYVHPEGQLFFTCFLDETIELFEDRSPERNGGFCVYRPDYLEKIVRQSGWNPVARHPGEGPIIGASFVCRPT